ncbi:von Willebrand factor type A domain protein [Pirellulimonas nuda]|uniref:von Willebrand factor type A domain protein n=2 Tax=Pirellulimonas nuda TaxID=2528009 RepID=A0A518D9M2_9BACT|nr:von Willebrand factor type A domain protein [Pirellulimonas nuda]
MLPLIAVLLPVLVLFLGFAVDVAHMQNTRMQLRLATDSAARAAASTLSRTDSLSQARTAAQDVANANMVAGLPLKVRSEEVEFGRSEPDANGKFVFTSGASPPNSVRVLGQKTNGSDSGSVPLFFGRLVGASSFEPTFTATASFINVDICLVLDRSTSMKVNIDSSESGLYTNDTRFCKPPFGDTRWAAVDRAVRVFTDAIDRSKADEKVALASYSSDLSKTLPGYCGVSNRAATLDEPLTSDIPRIDSALATITGNVWNGNTNIEAGMREGVKALTDTSRARQSAERIMIVLTDGAENEGSAEAAAQACADQRIRVHAITFGDFANQDAMKRVASVGRGQFFHAPDPTRLEEIFRELAGQVARLTE